MNERCPLIFGETWRPITKLSVLYRNALMELFGIEMKQSMTATLSRLHNRVTRTDISSQYDF